MRRTPPPSTLNELFVPNASYAYFDTFRQNPFRHDAGGYDQVNAWWLADACLLAYGDEGFTRQRLEAGGLAAAGFDVSFFAEKGAYCFVLHDERAVIAAFRGTQIDRFWPTVVDVVTDAKALPAPDGADGLVHAGFLRAFEGVWEGLRERVEQLISGTGRTLWLTGHSMGGALATLAADRFARAPGLTVRALYTFGSPRVGDENFRRRFAELGLDNKTFRFVHDFDAIARVPPEPLYRHVGLLKFIDSSGRLHHLDAAPLPHEPRLSDLTRALIPTAAFFAGAPALARLNRVPLPVPKPLADHAPIYYSVHLWNDLNP